ncbi:unnamed protein product [Peronospora belbahrii]|uniref:Uncharacterized protein n=1 Tax=Peronospora belbahrii TaxID=622444 RepID=A0ABN8CLB9_9STRA|nr:unnamed protein product [Peronospora belbahrii]
MQLLDEEEKLEPLSPPPAPHTPPHVRLLQFTRTRRRDDNIVDQVDEVLTPQSPPIPHAHPLQSLSDDSAYNINLRQDKGGMAIQSSQKLLRYGSVCSSERPNPTLKSREERKVLTKESQESDESIAVVETEHSNDAIAMELELQDKEMERMSVLVQLNERERAIAATKASARRHELLQIARQEARESRWRDPNYQGLSNGVNESALARASERKVGKQLDTKWVQTRQDPSNRPKGPLERPDERELRERLFRTTASDLIQSGVLFDESDAARNATFGPMSMTRLPVRSSGIVGLVGCCFEKYDNEF